MRVVVAFLCVMASSVAVAVGSDAPRSTAVVGASDKDSPSPAPSKKAQRPPYEENTIGDPPVQPWAPVPTALPTHRPKPKVRPTP